MDIDTKIADLETKHQETRNAILQLNDTLEQFMAQMQAPLPPPAPPVAPGPPAPARSPSPIHLSPTTPISTPKSNRLKPGVPPDFDGDRKAGRAFLNSCELYMSLCAAEFEDDIAKVKWTLSYMKGGRAAAFADRALRHEVKHFVPKYVGWRTFRDAFIESFCPENEAIDALMRLESTHYFQGKRSVDAYTDEFEDLIDLSGYKDKLTIVVKYRRGLSSAIQDKIAESGRDCPANDDPKGWYSAARRFDHNRLANEAFHSSAARRTIPPASYTPRQPFPSRPFIPFPATSTTQAKPPPAPALLPGVPMDVDAQRAKKLASTCHRCGVVGHFARDCPKKYDIRHMTTDEREGLLQDLLAAKDVIYEEVPKDEVSEATEEGEGFAPNDG
jgi:Zinc knuckle